MKFLFVILTIFFALDAYSIDYVFNASSGIVINWTSGDKVGVFAENDSQTRFLLNSVNGSDNHKATFYGPGFSLKNNKQYFGLCPFSNDYYENANVSSSLPVSFPTLTQSANGALEHIAKSDIMRASVKTTTENTATFTFSHICSVIRVCMTVPESATFDSAVLTSSKGGFMQSGVMNIETGAISNVVTAKSLNLALNDINVNRGNKLTVYFITPAVNLADATMTATITSTEGYSYQCSFAGKNLTAGTVNNIERTVVAVALPSSKAPRKAKLHPDSEAHALFSHYRTEQSSPSCEERKGK